MSHLVRSGPVKNIADESVAMGRHRYQVDVFLACQLDDLIRGFTKGKHSRTGKAFAGKLTVSSFEIRAVLLHLVAFGKLKLIKIPGYPAGGDVQQKQCRTSDARQRVDVRKNCFVSRTVLERNQNVVIHRFATLKSSNP